MIINGVRWGVHMVSPSHPVLLTPWFTHSLGVCDKATQTIYIDESLPQWKKREVLAHEIAHAAMFSYAIDLTYEEEEIVADILANHGEEIFKWTNTIYDGIKKIKGRL